MSGRLRKVLRWYGVGFGLGQSELMPGTWGTLPALPIAWILKLHSWLTVPGYLVLFFVSYLAARQLGRELGDSDHKSIVCDEIIGITPSLLFFPVSYWIAVFWVFRFFDILKPWPISLADSKVKGAIGCILDDVLAGLFTFMLVAAAINGL